MRCRSWDKSMVRATQTFCVWIPITSPLQLGNLHYTFEERGWSFMVSFYLFIASILYFSIKSSMIKAFICLILLQESEFSCFEHLCRESDEADEIGNSSKRQAKLSRFGFTTCESRSEEIESSGKGRCKFFQARKIQQLTQF